MFSLWAIDVVQIWWLGLSISMIEPPFSTTSLPGYDIFDIEVTGTASMKQKLCIIGYYWIRTTNSIHIFSRLVLSFHLHRRKIVVYSEFSLCWSPCLILAQIKLNKQIRKITVHFLIQNLISPFWFTIHWLDFYKPRYRLL